MRWLVEGRPQHDGHCQVCTRTARIEHSVLLSRLSGVIGQGKRDKMFRVAHCACVGGEWIRVGLRGPVWKGPVYVQIEDGKVASRPNHPLMPVVNEEGLPLPVQRRKYDAYIAGWTDAVNGKESQAEIAAHEGLEVFYENGHRDGRWLRTGMLEKAKATFLDEERDF